MQFYRPLSTRYATDSILCYLIAFQYKWSWHEQYVRLHVYNTLAWTSFHTRTQYLAASATIASLFYSEIFSNGFGKFPAISVETMKTFSQL